MARHIVLEQRMASAVMQDASMVHLEKWGYTKDRIIIF